MGMSLSNNTFIFSNSFTSKTMFFIQQNIQFVRALMCPIISILSYPHITHKKQQNQKSKANIYVSYHSNLIAQINQHSNLISRRHAKARHLSLYHHRHAHLPPY
ncbi:hypothetical protein Hanom_Chr17g01583531 [Helianthus anomalus]